MGYSPKDDYEVSFRLAQKVRASSEEEAMSALRRIIANFEDQHKTENYSIDHNSIEVEEVD